VTFWSDLFAQRHLISRTYYFTRGVTNITVPAKSAYARLSAVGAGGWIISTGAFGGGAAFARKKTTVTPGETLAVQVGSILHSESAGDALGDSIVTRVSGSVVLMKAARGTGTGPGLASSSTGDVKRDGSPGVTIFPSGGGGLSTASHGGASAGDDADTFPLGFGGRGAIGDITGNRRGAARGGGGAYRFVFYTDGGGGGSSWTFPPGDGLVCVEFFDQDPGY
jgi:hypothetical protein